MAKARIDRETCIGCGACWALCPDFFEQNSDDGKSQIVEKYRVGGNLAEGEIPAELLNDVKSAADGCPVQAITVEE